MKKLTLIEIQQVSFEVLKAFHDLCTENGLRYSLAYGTLIGAIRHKGFIPWDDDIDVMMPRKDFDKLLQLATNTGRFHIDHPSDTFLTFGRVYDTEKTICKSLIPWNKNKGGIWIDIFPIDYAPDNHEEFLKLHAECFELTRQQIRRRKMSLPFLKMKAKYKFKYLMSLFNKKKTLQYVIQKHLNLLESLPRTKHCSQLTLPDNGTKEYFPAHYMEEYIEVEFEGHKMMVIKEYDAYLRLVYNDYMQLPPIEKQVPLQDSYIQFYWKDEA